MNSQELRALQEAYSQVYELDEVKGIEGHINPNTGKSFYGLDSGLAMTPKKRMETRANSLQKKGEGKRANKIRAVMKRPSMEEAVDLYDIILSHLLDEGYADTEQAAEAIMVNMSEDWRESIMERREHDEPGEDDRNPDVRSHNRAVGYKSKPKQKYGSYDKRDRGGSEEDHEKSLGLQNLMRSVQGGSVKKSG